MRSKTSDVAPATAEPRSTAVERLAWWLDNAITVPGTRFRIGFDALIGLIPGLGDLVGTLFSSYIIAVAAAQGLPRSALARMAINVGLEAIIGVVPIAGDVFDAVWKANQRNVKLMEQFRAAPTAARRQSRAVVAAWMAGVVLFIAVLAAAVFALIRWIVTALSAG